MKRFAALAIFLIGCGGSSVQVTPSPDSLVNDCVSQINTFRAMVGSAPVERWSAGETCTAGEATKGGTDFNNSGTIVFHKYYPECHELYQNECWYSSSDSNVVVNWCNQAFFAEGPPTTGINHYSVMTDPKAKHVACELYHIPSPKGGWYMTQNYVDQ